MSSPVRQRVKDEKRAETRASRPPTPPPSPARSSSSSFYSASSFDFHGNKNLAGGSSSSSNAAPPDVESSKPEEEGSGTSVTGGGSEPAKDASVSPALLQRAQWREYSVVMAEEAWERLKNSTDALNYNQDQLENIEKMIKKKNVDIPEIKGATETLEQLKSTKLKGILQKTWEMEEDDNRYTAQDNQDVHLVGHNDTRIQDPELEILRLRDIIENKNTELEIKNAEIADLKGPEETLVSWLVFFFKWGCEVALAALEPKATMENKRILNAAVVLACMVLTFNVIEIGLSYYYKPWYSEKEFRFSRLPWIPSIAQVFVSSFEVYFYIQKRDFWIKQMNRMKKIVVKSQLGESNNRAGASSDLNPQLPLYQHQPD